MGVQLRNTHTGSRFWTLGHRPVGPACLGAHVFYLSAFHIASDRYCAGFRCCRKANTQNSIKHGSCWNEIERQFLIVIRVAILSTIYHVINNTVILPIHIGYSFHHAVLLHQKLSEDRSVRQLRVATKEFQSWFGPALLAEKVRFGHHPLPQDMPYIWTLTIL